MGLWVVGKAINIKNCKWEFQGVFSSEQRAIDACITDRYFVGPAVLDEALPDKRIEWPNAYYPFAKDRVNGS